MARRISARSVMVSILTASTPAAARARACRAKPAAASAAERSPSGAKSRPHGPIDPITHAPPAAACLASRIAYGVQVTPARLSRVERAEALLRSFGLAQLRVRDHGDLARIEVPVDALAELVDPGRRARLVDGLHDLGFTWVTLDLEGFRSGSMNELLADPGRYR